MALVGAVVSSGDDRDRAALRALRAQPVGADHRGDGVLPRPAGTLLSTHEVAVIVPVQAERMVCTAEVPAS